MIGFTKAIAREAARYRVRCNAVAPGPIETPLLNAAPAMLGEIGERLKQGDGQRDRARAAAGEPEEVAAAIAFLACDDASYVTGQTLERQRRPVDVVSAARSCCRRPCGSGRSGPATASRTSPR